MNFRGYAAMRKLPIVALLLTALGFGLVTAAPVQASDAGVRKVVKRHQARVAPLAEKFRKADQAVKSSADIPAAAEAAGNLRQGLRKYKNALTDAKAVSAKVKRGKKQLLTAIREFDLGLVEYQGLVELAGTGASEEQIKASLETINKRIAAAAEDEEAALKTLGFRVVR